jgi:hypothetical protein
MASARSLLLFVAACVAAALLVSKSTPAAAAPQDVVRLSSGSVVGLRTPEFIQVGKRYALTWAGGGPTQTTNPIYFVPGELPTRWLNAATAISIQEMRPFP